MTQELRITRDNHATIGTYTVELVTSKAKIEVHYTRPQAGVLYITYSKMPDIFLDAEIIDQVVSCIVRDARAENAKLVVIDKKVQSILALHPEWTDVIAA